MHFSDITSSLSNAISQTSKTEWAGFICSLAYIILIAFENSWGWLFGIIASVLTAYLCFSGNLFFESGLNIFYVIIGFYGWYKWILGSEKKEALPISKLSLLKNSYLILLGIIVWIPFAFVAKKYSTQAMPYLDAFITAFSIIATWMTARKLIENWIYWIILDALGILLFANRGFYLYALLYIVFISMSITGYFSWRKKMA
jgi:nicotinamide mononucleotide transporter